MVQAHHDFCPEADIPEDIEDGFHDFDEECTPCGITRAYVDGAPDCPIANCEDTSGNDAYTSLVENGCNIGCDSDVCRDLFFVLRIVHDTCDHDVLSRAAEEGLHDLERPCAKQLCNDPAAADKQLVCSEDGHDDHDDHGHDHGHGHSSHDDEDSGAGSLGGLATAAALVAGSIAALV